MALVKIQILSSGRIIWAKLSQAAKLVAQEQAVYAVEEPETPGLVPVETAAIAPPVSAPAIPRPKKGRR